MEPGGKVFSLLALLLVAILSCADASGTIQYFNVSNTRIGKNGTIVFRCGATLEQTDDGRFHTLIIQIRKWFPGSVRQWLLASNEQEEIRSRRYNATLHVFEQTREVEFSIQRAMDGDSGNYTCEAGRNNITVFVDIVSEPSHSELLFNSTKVSIQDTNPAYAGDNKKGEQVTVELGETYDVVCTVQGGNPPPAVTLSRGLMPAVPLRGVSVIKRSQRDAFDRMSSPLHVVVASTEWTATLANIGMPLNCMAGVENPVAVWTSFVPVVADRQPLFDCADKTGLMEGEADLFVTCRIVSTHDRLHSTKVHVYTSTDNFTIEAGIPDLPQDYPYRPDPRYIVRVVPKPGLHYWNVTLIIKNARKVMDLDSHKLEFLAENMYDITEHVVSVEAEGVTDPDSSTSKMTMSVATVLFTLVLGAFYRP